MVYKSHPGRVYKPRFFIKVACLQNETASEKILDRYENGLKNAKKDPKNDPKRVWNIFSSSQAA